MKSHKVTKSQSHKSRFPVIILFLLFFTNCQLFAQDSNNLVTLSKKIIESKNNEEVFASFEELKGLYFSGNKYSEFAEFLKSLSRQKESLAPFTDYYTALTRYNQLKYLEKTQNWDEYFRDGNSYRDQLTVSAKNAVGSTTPKDALNIYSRMLLWQFHKDQQDAFVEQSLGDLINSVSEYAKDATDINPVKAAADNLLSYGEQGKSKEVYRIYVNKLAGSVKHMKELEEIASGFYKEGNLELSEAVYDLYIERIKTYPKEMLIENLINIARDFSYKGEGPADAYYAEKIFKRIEEVAGTKDAFNEELSYLRAYNSEKMKDYLRAKDMYQDLLKRYPATKYADEAEFKVAIIFAYASRDIKSARDYFVKLSSKETVSPHVISALYHLGLLSQWENDLTQAKDYYNKLVEKAGNNFAESAALARERLKEIADARPLEYNLKSFLNVSLEEDSVASDVSKVDLNSSPSKAKKGEGVGIKCAPYSIESGCMAVAVQYLWSGETGLAKPTFEESEFKTTYAQEGTKVINLVIVSPTGILERSIEIVDVY